MVIVEALKEGELHSSIKVVFMITVNGLIIDIIKQAL